MLYIDSLYIGRALCYRAIGMPQRQELLQGTLDMLVLRTLLFGPLHGYGIAKSIQQVSNESLQIEFGSLYPALKRLELKGWIASRWDTSETNRRARFYRLTATGRKQLVREQSKWQCFADAIARVMQAAPEGGES